MADLDGEFEGLQDHPFQLLTNEVLDLLLIKTTPLNTIPRPTLQLAVCVCTCTSMYPRLGLDLKSLSVKVASINA